MERRKSARQELLDLGTELEETHIQALEDTGGNPAAFLHQSEEDVLRSHVLVPEALGLLARQAHHLPSSVGELIEHIVQVPVRIHARRDEV